MPATSADVDVDADVDADERLLAAETKNNLDAPRATDLGTIRLKTVQSFAPAATR